MLRLVCFLSLSFWLIAAQLFAQQPLLVAVKTGLPEQNRLDVVYPAADGYVYFGSGPILYRFSGLHLDQIAQLSTANTDFTQFFSYRGELWLGCSDGQIYILRGGRLMRFKPEEGLPAAAITGFAVDTAGQLWIGTNGEGLYCWTGKRLYQFGQDDGLPDVVVNNLHAWNNKVWAGTDGGLVGLSFIKGKKEVKVFSTDAGLPDNIVTHLGSYKNQLLLGFQSAGIGSFSGSLFTSITATNTAQGIEAMQVAEDELWWVDNEQNVFIHDFLSAKTRKIAELLPGKKTRVFQLQNDQNGNMWWLTQQGLFRHTTALQGLPLAERGIQALLLDKQNRMWYSAGDALYLQQLPEGKKQVVLQQNGLNIISLFEDHTGHIWAGSFGMGIWQIDPLRLKSTHFSTKDGLENGNVFSIIEQNDSLLLGTLGGIYCASLAQLKSGFHANPALTGIHTAYIFQLKTDSKGQLWVATDGESVYKGNKKSFRQIKSTEAAARTFTSISEDKLGQLWLSSPQHGLYQFKRDSLQLVFKPTADIAALANQGNYLYVVHAKGIDRLNIQNKHYYNWGKAQGLPDFEPYTNAIFQGETDIWIGGQEALYRIRYSQDTYDGPQLVLRAITLAGQHHDSSQHQLTADDNQISFDFDGLWLEDPEAVRFRFKLEGYGQEWVNTRNREITFPKLSPGDYTFVLEAAVHDDFEGAQGIKWSFRIAKPFYQQLWFIGLSLLTLLGFIIAYIQTRDRRLKKQGLMMQEKIQAQFETLKSQVSPHFLFNSFNTLLSLIESDPKKAAFYVEQLSDLFRNILKYREKDVISLREELDLIQAYAYLQEQRFGANFKLELRLDEEVKNSLIPPLTLQLLVENAIKHNVISRDKPLVVRITQTEKQLIIINPLQPKANSEASTGFGLRSIRDRYKLLSDIPIQISQLEQHYQIGLPLLFAS